jgi:hypothetical protein
LLLVSDIGDDHRTICADTHLRPVTFADSDSLFKAESRGEPVHRRSHVGIDENRDHSHRRNRSIVFH